MNKTVNLLLKTLEQNAEPKYLDFFHKLSPDIKALGVRSPILQKIVKKFSKEHDLLKALDKLDTNAPYELLYAKAFAISQLEFGEVKLAKIKEFLPYLKTQNYIKNNILNLSCHFFHLIKNLLNALPW